MESTSNGHCIRINQDILRTRPACLRAAEAALRDGKSVVVDNTNGKIAQREDWLRLAKQMGVVSAAAVCSTVCMIMYMLLFR